MKLQKVLLRWYKSFHLNYRQATDRGENEAYRPWNQLQPSYAGESEFPFIEIPIETDITTIVGGNESGKSHLLNAINKVIRGSGIQGNGAFARTDLCHYAGVRKINVQAWPNIGLQFLVETSEQIAKLRKAVGSDAGTNTLEKTTFTIILAPDDESFGVAYFEPNPDPIILDKAKVDAVRACLPRTQFINSSALLPSEIPLADLIRGYDPEFATNGLKDRESVETAAGLIAGLNAPATNQDLATFAAQLNQVKSQLKTLAVTQPSKDSLEMLLFKQILKVDLETLKYIYGLDSTDRGYIEGQIAKWNESLHDLLNLSHFWHQDDQFNLVLNYKDRILYFEIHDKTECIYTFNERSSGLKYFLSYYIQAKAMEMSGRNQRSIILMDEPDAALSILAQRNLLSVFESLVRPESSSQTCQLVYTTHSPYLINRNFPRRIAVVKKEDAEEGTQYIEQARARRYEPVRTALGIDSAPSLFLGSDNVLLEGATDQFLVTELIRIFATPENMGDFIDLNNVVMISADGVHNIVNVLEQSTWADEPIPATAILVDSDDAVDPEIERITRPDKPSKRLVPRESIGKVGELVQPWGANKLILTSEDIVPISLYRRAITRYIKRWLPSVFEAQATAIQTELENPSFGTNGIVESTKTLFKTVQPELNGDFDKMGIFQEVISEVVEAGSDPGSADEIEALRKNLKAICGFLNEALAEARARTTRHSATRSIKRHIKDFSRLNKAKVPITNIVRLLRRLDKEIEPVGNDGLDFSSVMKTYIAELEQLRSAGQQLLVGDDWSSWDFRIKAFRNNPIANAEQVLLEQAKASSTTKSKPTKKRKATSAEVDGEVKIAVETTTDGGQVQAS